MNIEIQGFLGDICLKKENLNQFIRMSNPMAKAKGMINLYVDKSESENQTIQYNKILKKNYNEQKQQIIKSISMLNYTDYDHCEKLLQEYQDKLELSQNLQAISIEDEKIELQQQQEKQRQQQQYEQELIAQEQQYQQEMLEKQKEQKTKQDISELMKKFDIGQDQAQNLLIAVEGNFDEACKILS